MSSADQARLELAKRAYQATAPGDAEVQTGVRRARLSLTRPKRRRNWFSRGLVFVVLAVGSLAYAKPHALQEIVEKVLPRDDAASKRGARDGGVSATVDAAGASKANAAAAPVQNKSPGANANGNESAHAQALEAPSQLLLPAAAAEADIAATAKKAGTAARATTATSATSRGKSPGSKPSTSPEASAADGAANTVTNWGRVGQALARGDDTAALSALSELSESDDQRTRDKADMGRAQLLMAHGDLDKACALARSLTQRRAGGRIERQAQLLLKNCGR